MKKVRILGGQHFSIWPRVGLRRGALRESWKFGASCRYDHGNENQWDWNKLTGISWGISAQKCSVMVGWRWNPAKRFFELNLYAHDQNFQDGRFMTDTIFSVRAGEVFMIEIFEKDPNRWVLRIGDGFVEDHRVVFIPESGGLGRVVNCWFGGNEVAPHEMELWRGDFMVINEFSGILVT